MALSLSVSPVFLVLLFVGHAGATLETETCINSGDSCKVTDRALLQVQRGSVKQTTVDEKSAAVNVNVTAAEDADLHANQNDEQMDEGENDDIGEDEENEDEEKEDEEKEEDEIEDANEEDNEDHNEEEIVEAEEAASLVEGGVGTQYVHRRRNRNTDAHLPPHRRRRRSLCTGVECPHRRRRRTPPSHRRRTYTIPPHLLPRRRVATPRRRTYTRPVIGRRRRRTSVSAPPRRRSRTTVGPRRRASSGGAATGASCSNKPSYKDSRACCATLGLTPKYTTCMSKIRAKWVR